MISLMEKQEIILSHFREGKSQWQIHRETGIDRKTIRKYIRDYDSKRRQLLETDDTDTELISDIIAAPKYDSSNRIRRKLSDSIIERIQFFLKENEIKKSTGRSKQQKKKVDIYECLIEEGFNMYLNWISCFLLNKFNCTFSHKMNYAKGLKTI